MFSVLQNQFYDIHILQPSAQHAKTYHILTNINLADIVIQNDT